jgi:hypothetical protein
MNYFIAILSEKTYNYDYFQRALRTATNSLFDLNEPVVLACIKSLDQLEKLDLKEKDRVQIAVGLEQEYKQGRWTQSLPYDMIETIAALTNKVKNLSGTKIADVLLITAS